MKKKVESSTIARTIILAIALVNQFLSIAGFCPLPLEEETLYELISCIFTVIASIWSWWKNNSFTQKAIAADEWKNKQNIEKEEDVA